LETDYISVTEIAGDEVTQEQIERLCNRYYWAGRFCEGKDVVETACGTGQGLGYLSTVAGTFEAGDYSEEILKIARTHYGERIGLKNFDASDMPFEDNSKDVIILFEAIYYLQNAEKFVDECRRVLRPGGLVLIASANMDLPDFNPSPYSHRYYGVVELKELFQQYEFNAQFYGDTPMESVSIRQKILSPVKKMVVKMGLMPKTMAGKKLLKRLAFGNLVPMPSEIDANTATYTEPKRLEDNQPDRVHKVIYCSATLNIS